MKWVREEVTSRGEVLLVPRRESMNRQRTEVKEGNEQEKRVSEKCSSTQDFKEKKHGKPPKQEGGKRRKWEQQ